MDQENKSLAVFTIIIGLFVLGLTFGLKGCVGQQNEYILALQTQCSSTCHGSYLISNSQNGYPSCICVKDSNQESN